MSSSTTTAAAAVADDPSSEGGEVFGEGTASGRRGSQVMVGRFGSFLSKVKSGGSTSAATSTSEIEDIAGIGDSCTRERGKKERRRESGCFGFGGGRRKRAGRLSRAESC